MEKLKLTGSGSRAFGPARLYWREGAPLRIVHLNVYNGYTGVQLKQATLVEGVSYNALPDLSEPEP